jgi:hypothetical protein
MTNDAQLPMMKNMLNTALKAGIPMNLFHCYILNSQKEVATYGTPEFNSITIKKLEVILSNLDLDDEILWVDNDIVFFKNCIHEIQLNRGNFVMQDDLWGACTGFFLSRSSAFAKHTIQKSIHWLMNSTMKNINDQDAFNQVYPRIPGLIVTKLPVEEYPNGEIYFNQGRKSKAKMMHCNYLYTTAEKVKRLKDNNMWNESNTAFDLTNHYII